MIADQFVGREVKAPLSRPHSQQHWSPAGGAATFCRGAVQPEVCLAAWEASLKPTRRSCSLLVCCETGSGQWAPSMRPPRAPARPAFLRPPTWPEARRREEGFCTLLLRLTACWPVARSAAVDRLDLRPHLAMGSTSVGAIHQQEDGDIRAPLALQRRAGWDVNTRNTARRRRRRGPSSRRLAFLFGPFAATPLFRLHHSAHRPSFSTCQIMPEKTSARRCHNVRHLGGMAIEGEPGRTKPDLAVRSDVEGVVCASGRSLWRWVVARTRLRAVCLSSKRCCHVAFGGKFDGDGC